MQKICFKNQNIHPGWRDGVGGGKEVQEGGGGVGGGGGQGGSRGRGHVYTYG